MSRKDRVNIAVAAEIASKLGELAEKRGMTMFSLANESLGVMLELLEDGLTPREVKESIYLFRILNELETVPVPARLMDRMMAALYHKARDEAEAMFCDAGRAIANYLVAVFGSLSNVIEVVSQLPKYVPIKRIDVNERGDMLQVELVGVGYSNEAAYLVKVATKCLVEAMGYEEVDSGYSAGVVYVKARRVEKRGS